MSSNRKRLKSLKLIQASTPDHYHLHSGLMFQIATNKARNESDYHVSEPRFLSTVSPVHLVQSHESLKLVSI